MVTIWAALDKDHRRLAVLGVPVHIYPHVGPGSGILLSELVEDRDAGHPLKQFVDITNDNVGISGLEIDQRSGRFFLPAFDVLLDVDWDASGVLTIDHWPFVPRILGIVLVAAGAADGHDLVVSARDADWFLLIRADLELLGGFWLLSGRFPRGARISAIITFVSILAYDVARMLGGYSARHVVGQIATCTWWVFSSDLLILAGLLRWRTGPAHAARIDSYPGRFAAASFIAAAIGVAIDRSQVGQFPIIAMVRANRSTSGLDYLVYLPDGYYRSLERWPLILTLDGRGEAGLDIGFVRRQGLPRRIEENGGLPFVTVAPLSSDWAWNVEALDALLDEVLKRYRVDLDRVFVTGNSIGG